MKKEKIYECIADLQGDCFCVGVTLNVEGWRELALDMNDLIYHPYIEKMLLKLEGQELIDYIAETWQIEIIEDKEN